MNGSSAAAANVNFQFHKGTIKPVYVISIRYQKGLSIP